jgi:hypothetical protein
MVDWTFSQEDRWQMKALGISEEQVRIQIQIFQKSSLYVRLHRPCTIGDGIQQIASDELATYIGLQEKAAREGRFLKFVPASGAASRMFKTPFQIYHQTPTLLSGEIPERAARGDPEEKDFLCFQKGIQRMAFFEDLKTILASNGLQIENLLNQDRWREILEYLLTERGLNYGALPKGLLKFHRYPSGGRTAFEEHLVEAVYTVRDREGICRLHLTVSPEHEEAFRQFLERIKPWYEQHYQSCFEVTFSVQKHSTDTIAVDLENQPFREKDGRILFRPGGHGALLENLNDLQGDLIYLKNIDNVLPDRFKEPTLTWKKVLGGFLLKIKESVNGYVGRLMEGQEDMGLCEEAMAFAQNKLFIPEPRTFKQWMEKEKRDFLLSRLNRPLRVCGMVKNEGEPGGGPFWVEGRDGTLSLQIVESAQVDPQSFKQQAIWASSTHFNPVDLVCAVRDFRDRPFHLERYVDPEAVFISQKSKDGRDLKSMELPGLWNGAMAEWITFFVEVPITTFNPVKTINDLLRPEHQPE